MSSSSKRPRPIIYWRIQEYTGKRLSEIVDIYGYYQGQDTWYMNFYILTLDVSIIFLEKKINQSITQKPTDSDEIQIISISSNVNLLILVMTIQISS